MKNPIKGSNGPILAFVILALAGGWAIASSDRSGADKLYDSQVLACNKGNKVIGELNERVDSNITVQQSLEQFLSSAREARLSSGSRTDLAAAEAYGRLIVKVSKVQYHKVPLVDCQHDIKKP